MYVVMASATCFAMSVRFFFFFLRLTTLPLSPVRRRSRKSTLQVPWFVFAVFTFHIFVPLGHVPQRPLGVLTGEVPLDASPQSSDFLERFVLGTDDEKRAAVDGLVRGSLEWYFFNILRLHLLQPTGEVCSRVDEATSYCVILSLES